MTATCPDYDQIVRVVQLYIDAFNDGDVNKFKEAFHEDAWMFYTDRDGVLHKRLLEENVFAHMAAEGRKVNGRIVLVTQAGDIANVLLGWDDVADPPDPRHSSWVDFHTLLRINGVWKIMNKTSTHSSRAAWAANSNVQAKRQRWRSFGGPTWECWPAATSRCDPRIGRTHALAVAYHRRRAIHRRDFHPQEQRHIRPH